MQKSITLSQIEYMIKEKKQILERLAALERSLLEEIKDEKFIIESVAYKKPNINMLNDNIINGSFTDLYDTVEKYQSVSEKINANLLYQLNDIIDERETLSRVWSCFSAIRASGKYYDVLYEYLIKDVPMSIIAARYDRSIGTIRSWKKKGLIMVMNLYERKDISTGILGCISENGIIEAVQKMSGNNRPEDKE